MKRLFLLLSYVISSLFTLLSQIPDGYYDSAVGKIGDELKTVLYTIIKDHSEYPYASRIPRASFSIIRHTGISCGSISSIPLIDLYFMLSFVLSALMIYVTYVP